ncbi:MAG: hypothetical protein FJX53_05665, partial [Alphaproteobacteria bacterium]|nr:hypothetical protein [Alphaproteobacteria bacterium]
MRVGGTFSGLTHAIAMAALLFGWPAFGLVFEHPDDIDEPIDVLAYGKGEDFKAAFRTGKLVERLSEDSESKVTTGGIDPDDSSPTDSTGDAGFTSKGTAGEDRSAAGRPDVTREGDANSAGLAPRGEAPDETARPRTARIDVELNQVDQTSVRPGMREIVVNVELARPSDLRDREPDRKPSQQQTEQAAASPSTARTGAQAASATTEQQEAAATPPPAIRAEATTATTTPSGTAASRQDPATTAPRRQADAGAAEPVPAQASPRTDAAAGTPGRETAVAVTEQTPSPASAKTADTPRSQIRATTRPNRLVTKLPTRARKVRLALRRHEATRPVRHCRSTGSRARSSPLPAGQSGARRHGDANRCTRWSQRRHGGTDRVGGCAGGRSRHRSADRPYYGGSASERAPRRATAPHPGRCATRLAGDGGTRTSPRGDRCCSSADRCRRADRPAADTIGRTGAGRAGDAPGKARPATCCGVISSRRRLAP